MLTYDPYGELCREVVGVTQSISYTGPALFRVFDGESETGFDPFWGVSWFSLAAIRIHANLPGLIQDHVVNRHSARWHANRHKLRNRLNHERQRSPLTSTTNSAWRVTRCGRDLQEKTKRFCRHHGQKPTGLRRAPRVSAAKAKFGRRPEMTNLA